jgi:C1A family cysteine protease
MGFLRNKQKLPYLVPSRNFIYYNTRALEGTTATDAGASIADTMKAMAAQGACSEWRWPYTTADLTVKPSADAYTAGLLNKVVTYLSVPQTQAAMTACLVAGFPFCFGINVYTSFESDAADANGIIPMPNVSTEQLLGGHALLAIGYNISGKDTTVDVGGKSFTFPTGTVMFRNSWNATWGAGGYGFIPLTYLESTTLASDFWTPRLVT